MTYRVLEMQGKEGVMYWNVKGTDLLRCKPDSHCFTNRSMLAVGCLSLSGWYLYTFNELFENHFYCHFSDKNFSSYHRQGVRQLMWESLPKIIFLIIFSAPPKLNWRKGLTKTHQKWQEISPHPGVTEPLSERRVLTPAPDQGKQHQQRHHI